MHKIEYTTQLRDNKTPGAPGFHDKVQISNAGKLITSWKREIKSSQWDNGRNTAILKNCVQQPLHLDDREQAHVHFRLGAGGGRHFLWAHAPRGVKVLPVGSRCTRLHLGSTHHSHLLATSSALSPFHLLNLNYHLDEEILGAFHVIQGYSVRLLGTC